MTTQISRCEDTTNWTTSGGGVAPMTPNTTDFVEGTASLDFASGPSGSVDLRCSVMVNLEFEPILNLAIKPLDTITQAFTVQVMTDWGNYKSWLVQGQFVLGQWSPVQIDLRTAGNTALGTLNLASISMVRITTAYTTPVHNYRIDDIRAEASGEVIYHTLTLDSTPANVVYVQPVGTAVFSVQVERNTSFTIEAPSTHAGMTFSHFLVDGQPSVSNPLTVTLTADMSVVAVYATAEGIVLAQYAGLATLDPFTYMGDGTYAFFDSASDPNGSNSPGVTLTVNPATAGRSSMSYSEPTASFGESKVEAVFALSDVANMDGILLITSTHFYQTGNSICWLSAYNGKYRVSYYNNGATTHTDFGVATLGIHTVSAVVKVGSGNGSISITIDGTVWSLSNLNNFLHPINAWEIGSSWSTAGVQMQVYNARILGTVLDQVTVQGTVVDSVTLAPLTDVGVRVGVGEDLNKPWNNATLAYSINIYTDINGFFSFSFPRQPIPDIKFVKYGYGAIAEKAGSVTHRYNVDISNAVGTYDLGTIPLTPRIPIASSPLPAGNPWEFRAVTMFPFSKNYSTNAFTLQLDSLVAKFQFNMVDVRLQTTGINGIPTLITTDIFGLSESTAAVQKIHDHGLKAMVSVMAMTDTTGADYSGVRNEAWMAGYKQVVMQVAQWASPLQPEYFLINFENFLNLGQANDLWLDILNSVRTYAASVGWQVKVGATMNIEYYPNVPANLTEWWDRIKSNTWWSECDFLMFEDWTRKSAYLDPSANDIHATMQTSLTWDVFHPDYTIVFQQLREYFGVPVFVNCGSSGLDGANLRPWGFSNKSVTVTDLEEEALTYKTILQGYGEQVMDGILIEHYSFDYDASGQTGCFNGRPAEAFIREVVASHVGTTTTITVVAGANGSVFPSGSYIMTSDVEYSFLATPALGYYLDHWDLGGESKGSTNPLKLVATATMEGKTLTAIFSQNVQPITMTIAITGNGTTDQGAGQKTYNVGDTVTITAIPQSGATFNGWKLDGAEYATENPLQLTITADLEGKTLTADFTTSNFVLQAGIGLGLLSLGVIYFATRDKKKKRRG